MDYKTVSAKTKDFQLFQAIAAVEHRTQVDLFSRAVGAYFLTMDESDQEVVNHLIDSDPDD